MDSKNIRLETPHIRLFAHQHPSEFKEAEQTYTLPYTVYPWALTIIHSHQVLIHTFHPHCNTLFLYT